MKKNWVEVDLDGLRKLIDQRGKSFAIYELIQNAWDTDAKNVRILLEKHGRNVYIEVEDDDPEGFTHMEHAFTMFAESTKKNDPTKRGRFNLGEKLVLSICESAEIHTMKGRIAFDENGSRHMHKGKEHRRKKGTLFSATITIKRDEYDEIVEGIERLIAPKGVTTKINIDGDVFELTRLDPVVSFEVVLPTMRSDDEGNMKRTKRKTRVDIFNPIHEQETGWIYEMGIPVVETGDSYVVDVQQKVPLNMDRDNVTPAYLKMVRAEVYNHTYDILDEEDAGETWVDDALASDDIDDVAVKAALTARYGERRAIFDPNDLEANNRLVSQGYSLIKGRQLSKKAWENVRSSGAARPSGQIAPTPALTFSAEGEPLDVIEPGKWTDGMAAVYRMTREITEAALGFSVDSQFIRLSRSKGGNFGAAYGDKLIRWNVSVLGKKWFDANFDMTKFLDLLIHEVGHEWSDSHLDDDYYKALSKIGAKFALLALEDPELFDVNREAKVVEVA